MFAEDCGSTSCSPDGREHLCATDEVDDRIFNHAFPNVDLIQNLDKAVRQILPNATGSPSVMRDLNRSGGVAGAFKFDTEA